MQEYQSDTYILKHKHFKLAGDLMYRFYGEAL